MGNNSFGVVIYSTIRQAVTKHIIKCLQHYRTSQSYSLTLLWLLDAAVVAIGQEKDA